MEEPAREPEESTTKAKWSEATGQAILLTGMAWALFIVLQARWYIPAFDARPYGAKWLAVTLLTGAAPPLLVLLLAFLGSWLIGALRCRADPWRSYRDGLIVACVFTILLNLGIWLLQAHQAQ
jgi:hypothetical protein